MLKGLLRLAAVAGLAALCACAAEKVEPKVAIISSNPSSPPMSWLEDGSLHGTGPDCAKIAISSLEIAPVVRYEGDWSQVLDKARTGEIDVVSALFKTAERETYLVFSIPYATVPVSVCVKSGGKFPFSRLEDLKGRKGLVGTGESYGEDFDRYAREELKIGQAPLKECLAAVASGKADYLVVNLNAGMISAYESGLSDALEFLETPVSTQNYHMAISKRSKHAGCIDKLNLKLTEMKIDGAPERLTAKYLILWRNRSIQHLGSGAAPNAVEP